MQENGPSSHHEDDAGGLITAVEIQTKDPSRLSIFLDGVFAIGIHRDVATKFELRKGKVLGASELQLLREAETHNQACRSALHLLSYRTRTSAEMYRRLVRKGYPEAVATSVVCDLQDGGLLDDAAFAHEFAVQKVASGKVGRHRIGRDLARRGIDRATAERAIEASTQGADFRSAALALAIRKWEAIPTTLPIAKKRKRLFDYLARRGFAFDIIRSVVSEVAV